MLEATDIYRINKRLKILNLPGLDLRLMSQAANLGIKLLNGDIQSDYRNIIESYLHENRFGLRNIYVYFNITGISPPAILSKSSYKV